MPSWATRRLPGDRQRQRGQRDSEPPGSYFTISRTWRSGDTVRVTIPFRLRVEKALDDPTLQTLFYGPVNLVARNSSTSHLQVGLYRNAALSGDLLPSLTPVAGKPLHYTLNGTEFAPFYEGTEDRTHAYFRRAEPKVVFGNTDSGVANPAKSDGTTLLDEIWAGAPFATKAAAGDAGAVDGGRVGVRGPAHPGQRSAGGHHGAERDVRALTAAYVP